MAKLTKLESRFSKKQCQDSPKMRGFHRPQAEKLVLAADEKPQHGVKQPMPEFKRA